MREILFRAQTRKRGEQVLLTGEPVESNWEYGVVLQGPGDFSILYDFDGKHSVYTDTICEYTGIKDKNGNKIFESDIILTQPFTDRPYSAKAKEKRHVAVVKHKIRTFKSNTYEQDYAAEWVAEIKNIGKFGYCNWNSFFKCEVIGNIYDNPELLAEENN